jgi:PAS domain S-box-containing protein
LTETAPLPDRATPPPRRVLVVDSTDESRRRVTSVLQQAGFAVTEASTGEDGLRLIRTSEPDVIVLDVQQPDGIAVSGRLKVEPGTGTIPVLFLSTSAMDVGARTLGDEAGVEAYLTKPFEPFELVSAVTNLARLRETEAALRTRDILHASLIEQAEIRRRVAEAAKEHYQLLFERNLAGVFRSHGDGRIIECNEAFARLLGHRGPADTLQHNAWDFYVDDVERAWLLASLASDRRVTNREMRWRRSGGEEITVMMNATQVGNGPDARIEGVVIDVSARKRADDAVRAREIQLRHLGDNLPDGVIYQVVRRLDGSNYFPYMSSGLEQTFGVTAAEAMADASLVYRLVPPEDLARIRDAADESMRTSDPIDVEYRMRTPAGEIRWMNLRGRPSRLPNGETMWDVIALDITNRKRADEELRQQESELEAVAEHLRRSEERYRLLFERSFVGIFRTRADGILLECNDAFAHILGYASAAETRGCSVIPHYATPEDRDRVVARISAGEDVVEAEMIGRRLDGSLVPVAMSVRRVVGQDGAVHEGVLVDLSRRQRADGD